MGRTDKKHVRCLAEIICETTERKKKKSSSQRSTGSSCNITTFPRIFTSRPYAHCSNCQTYIFSLYRTSSYICGYEFLSLSLSRLFWWDFNHHSANATSPIWTCMLFNTFRYPYNTLNDLFVYVCTEQMMLKLIEYPCFVGFFGWW